MYYLFYFWFTLRCFFYCIFYLSKRTSLSILWDKNSWNESSQPPKRFLGRRCFSITVTLGYAVRSPSTPHKTKQNTRKTCSSLRLCWLKIKTWRELVLWVWSLCANSLISFRCSDNMGELLVAKSAYKILIVQVKQLLLSHCSSALALLNAISAVFPILASPRCQSNRERFSLVVVWATFSVPFCQVW